MAEQPRQGAGVDLQSIDLQKLWQEVNEAIRRGPVNRGLWDAAARAVPIAIENGTLILGLDPADARYAGYLETSANRARIQEILLARTGHRLDIRVIEGTTKEDWERVKQLDRLSEMRAETHVAEREARRAAARVWEDVNDELLKLFTAAGLRRYPLTLARLFAKALGMVYEAEVKARETDPEASEFHERELNRLCDKLATYCDLPPTVVAVEYLRYRATRRQKAGQ